MAVVRGFQVLTGSYLGQDWDEYGSTVDEALTVFLHEGRSDDIAASVAGFEALLASPMTDDELDHHWIYELHSGYDPRDDGHTYREWFAHALSVLRAAAPPTG